MSGGFKMAVKDDRCRGSPPDGAALLAEKRYEENIDGATLSDILR